MDTGAAGSANVPEDPDVDAEQLLGGVLRTLGEHGYFDPHTDQPVVRFLHPEQLQKELPVRLEVQGSSPEEVKRIIEQIVRYSVRTCSPHFHNQLYAGVDAYGLAGACLTEVLNTSQ